MHLPSDNPEQCAFELLQTLPAVISFGGEHELLVNVIHNRHADIPSMADPVPIGIRMRNEDVVYGTVSIMDTSLYSSLRVHIVVCKPAVLRSFDGPRTAVYDEDRLPARVVFITGLSNVNAYVDLLKKRGRHINRLMNLIRECDKDEYAEAVGALQRAMRQSLRPTALAKDAYTSGAKGIPGANYYSPTRESTLLVKQSVIPNKSTRSTAYHDIPAQLLRDVISEMKLPATTPAEVIACVVGIVRTHRMEDLLASFVYDPQYETRMASCKVALSRLMAQATSQEKISRLERDVSAARVKLEISRAREKRATEELTDLRRKHRERREASAASSEVSDVQVEQLRRQLAQARQVQELEEKMHRAELQAAGARAEEAETRLSEHMDEAKLVNVALREKLTALSESIDTSDIDSRNKRRNIRDIGKIVDIISLDN